MNYLLEQVNIGNDYTQLLSPLDPTGVREVSGANNNLVGGFTYNADGTVTWTGNNINPDWGQSDTDFLRIFATDHPNNGTSYGFTFDPVTMQVIDSGDGTPILGADGQPVIVPADFATQFAEAAIPDAGHLAAHHHPAHHQFRRRPGEPDLQSGGVRGHGAVGR